MPIKIPEIFDAGNISTSGPRRGGSGPGQQSVIKGYGFLSDAQQRMSTVLRGISNNLGKLASQFNQEAIQARAATQYNDAKALATKGFTDWATNIKNISPYSADDPNQAPNFQVYGEQWQGYQQGLYDEAIKKIKDPRAKVDFDAWWISAQDRSKIFTASFQDSEETDYMRAAFMDRKAAYIEGRDKFGLVNDAQNMVDSQVYSAQEMAEMLEVDTHLIDLSSTRAEARGMGLEQGIEWLKSSDEANKKYDITDDERWAIALDMDRELTFLQAEEMRINAENREKSYWQGYLDVRDSKTKDPKLFADENLYPGLTTADQINLTTYMDRKMSDDKAALAAAQQEETDATLSSFNAKIIAGTFTGEDYAWIQKNAPDRQGEYYKLWNESAEGDVTANINAYMSTHVLNETLTEDHIEWLQSEEVDRPDLVEHWNRELRLMRERMQIAQTNKRAKATDLWEETSPQFMFTFYDHLHDESWSDEDLLAWVREHRGPDMTLGQPRIGAKDYDRFIEDIKDRTPADPMIRAGQDQVSSWYDSLIRGTDDPREKLDLEQEKARALRAFNQNAYKKEDPMELAAFIVDPPQRTWAERKVAEIGVGLEKAIDAVGTIAGAITGQPLERTVEIARTDQEWLATQEPADKPYMRQAPVNTGMTGRQATEYLSIAPKEEVYMTVGEYFRSIGQEPPEFDDNGQPIDPYKIFHYFDNGGAKFRVTKDGTVVRIRGEYDE